ncbi:hypothetical protein M501DRAFT_975049 [Patellaria atrata CBS 101060]|uniref:Uncharacterized protein n=1 Tax=Patellaria atrata CBS 101060 TaxID=1346257 RepID=A0A9P4VME5_9PEZI|nr:hypothetical protein M501DRAFT_975049 [Patellaria atrata CBS 101060]
MASRFLLPAVRRTVQPSLTRQTRSFQTSGILRDAAAAPVAVKKPVGAFRGGIFGFLLGSVASGAGMYYYVLDEYKVSNELLTTDIYALQAAVQRIENYVRTLEEKFDASSKKK